MFKLKGLYEWELINKDTQKVDQKGEQWNVISDVFHSWMFRNSVNATYCYGGYTSGMTILLSNSLSDPGTDYRKTGKSNWFNILATGANQKNQVDWALKSKYCSHTFDTTGTPRTISIIGIKLLYNNSGGSYTDDVAYKNFVSFIELSTPITQNTDQYLYVKYTVFCTFTSLLGYGTPANRYVDYFMNQSLFTNNLNLLGSVRAPGIGLTSFLPPVSINNVMRFVPPIYVYTIADNVATHYGSPLSRIYVKDFTTTSLTGPVGVVAFQQYSSLDENSEYYYYMNTLYNYSQTKDLAPSIARIFLHPGTRDAYLFSDPSFPATSQGTLSAAGTPTNKYPMIARIRITKTGDATDLIDETVAYTAVNTGNSQITIAQDFTTGDIYQVSSSGTLPSPLIAGTNYYIIRIDSTHIRLATSAANAAAGTFIPLTTQGTGNHTFVRQNTGTYRLELEPYTYALYLNNTNLNVSGIVVLNQLSMGVDYDGFVMPAVLTNTVSNANALAEGDYVSGVAPFLGVSVLYPGTNTMLRGAAQNGDYIYSVQQSRKGLIHNICRWRFNTIETSQPLCKFGNGSTVIVSTLSTSTKMYIVTNDGIYEYTYATPTVAPALITITGMVSSVISDACIDPVTGYMWTGHTTGLSRINLGTLTATQYVGGAGGALNGLTTAELNIYPGQLDAYNGRVLRGSGTFGDSTYAGVSVNTYAWVMDDGIGWYRVNGSTACYGSCLRKGTSEVVWRGLGTLTLYSVTVTGVGTGTVTTTETRTGLTNVHSPVVNFVQISSTRFIYLYQESSTGSNHIYSNYVIGYSPTDTNIFQSSHSAWAKTLSGYGWAVGARRNLIDVDGNGNYMFIYHNWLVSTQFPSPVSYGWNGSAWVRDNPNSRSIPKTATHTLVNGLSVDFNNATGTAWDLQFVLNDCFNICHGPYRIKDNLQTLQIKCKNYTCAAYVVESYGANVGAVAPYIISIPEKSDPNFRDMDNQDFVTEVSQGATVFTQYVPAIRSVTYTIATDIVNSGTGSIPTGTPILFYSGNFVNGYGTLIAPLENGVTYYAINVNTTTIRVATTYANALANTYINLDQTSTGTQYMMVLTPTAGTYYASLSGDFFFNSADAGKAMTLTYTYTKFST